MGSSFPSPSKTRALRYIPKNKKHEETLQQKVCNYLHENYPHAIFRSDFASGLHLTKFQAIRHKRLQSSRSWPDLFIYYPTVIGDKTYCGLAIELKKDGTTVILKTGPRKDHFSSNPHIQEQAAMLKRLNALGYSGHFAVGYDEAIKIIDWYFQKPKLVNEELF